MTPWAPLTISEGTCQRWQVGPLCVWVRHARDEWHVASKREEHSGEEDANSQDAVVCEPCEDLPEGVDWARWAGITETDAAQVLPVMPDRSVVVRPEAPVTIPKGCEARFFVSVPVTLAVYVGEKKDTQLCELPTVVMSNIWFGDPMSGELCYSLRTRARRTYAAEDTEPHCALCPVTIENKAVEPLNVERFCVRTEHLALYQGEAQMWASTATMRFRGGDEPAQLDFGKAAPDWEPVGAPVSEAREPFKRGMFKRSFSSFSFLPGH